MTLYTPYNEVWTTIVTDVAYIQPALETDPTHYYCTVIPNDPNELGGATGVKQVGDYLKDFVGSTYTIVAINVDGNANRIEVSDDQFTGAGPQSGQYAYIYRSVVDGDAPYLAPIRHLALDKTALDYSRAIELEVLWREATHTKKLFNTFLGKDALINADPDISSLNLALGHNSLKYLTGGNYNTGIGAYSGLNIADDILQYRVVNDAYLTLIGYNATKDSVNSIVNSTALGANSIVTKSNQVVIGDSLVSEVKTSGTIIAPTINLTSNPTEGYFWQCVDSSTGAGQWVPITSSQTYKGTVDGSTGIPAGSSIPLADGTGTSGDYYHAYVAGTYDYGSGPVTLAIGDDLMYSNSGIWQRIEGRAYILQTASDTVLGGVKIGSGVSIDGSGVISVSTNYQAPLNGTGLVRMDGTTVSYDSNTYLTSESYLGTVTAVGTSSTATGLTLTGGTITGSGTITLGLASGYQIPTTSQINTWNSYTGYTHPSYTPVNQTLSGATVLYTFSSDSIGSVTGFTTRTLTLANLGYTGDTGADYYGYFAISASGTAGNGYVYSGNNLSFVGSGATAITRSSNQITITSTDTNTWIANAIGVAGYVAAAPNSALYYWGTNASTVLGWWALPSSGGSGTVTSVSAGAGMNFTTITGSGSVIMGTPSSCSPSTSNTASGTTHTHTITGVEPSLGNPSVSGYVLSSTTAGVRSWVAMSGGGGTTTNALSFNTTSVDNGYLYATLSSFNGSSAVTIGVNATTSNTANTIVARDSNKYVYAQEFYRGSSRELKHEIRPISFSAIEYLKEIAIMEYLLNESNDTSIGFIAEDTDELLSGPSRKLHNFGTHLGLLTRAMQEEDSKIVMLEKRVKELEEQVRLLS